MKNTSTMDTIDSREDLYMATEKFYGHHKQKKKHPWKSKLSQTGVCVLMIIYLVYEFFHGAHLINF